MNCYNRKVQRTIFFFNDNNFTRQLICICQDVRELYATSEVPAVGSEESITLNFIVCRLDHWATTLLCRNPTALFLARYNLLFNYWDMFFQYKPNHPNTMSPLQMHCQYCNVLCHNLPLLFHVIYYVKVSI